MTDPRIDALVSAIHEEECGVHCAAISKAKLGFACGRETIIRATVTATLRLAAEEMRGLFGHDINAMYAAVNLLRALADRSSQGR